MTKKESEELLFIGDVHLGRRPVRLDNALEKLGLKASQLSPEVALEKTVQSAVDSPPRAVVFAGDIVDQEEDRFEALHTLEQETRKLEAAGIPVFAIAGNHDGHILPRLIQNVPSVRLLGEGARWECIAIPGPGRDVDLLGWSFPKRHFSDCPLDHGDFAAALEQARPGATRLGVLHTDLDATGSNFAPVSRTRLAEAGLDAWLLGHTHKPSLVDSPRPLGYLGSLVGLDIGEPGPRGAWRVHCGDDKASARQLNLGPIRWESIKVHLDPSDAEDDLAVHNRIKTALAKYAQDQALVGTHRLLVANVQLTGELEHRAAVDDFLKSQNEGPLPIDSGEIGLPTILRKTTDETHALVNLAQLAKEPTPVGHIARELITFLETGQLPDEILAAFEQVEKGGWPLDSESDPMPKAGELFEQAAWQALRVLLAQSGAQSS